MENYVLNPYRGGKTLYPHNILSSEEYVHSHHSFSLDAHYLKDERGKVLVRYQFYTHDPITFNESLEYDIKCPRCGSVMRLCGNGYDGHYHGLYKCRRCDGEGGR
ncbi:MAG: hypothetical protein KBS81_10335 [Spirochaetales bacterium]|nr:hypothetical protein [Candidatus Physcosoma equi]